MSEEWPCTRCHDCLNSKRPELCPVPTAEDLNTVRLSCPYKRKNVEAKKAARRRNTSGTERL